jgi:hypothetical protein
VARKQAELGVDIINDGEHNKSVYSGYLWTRLAGLDLRAGRSPERAPRLEAALGRFEWA